MTKNAEMFVSESLGSRTENWNDSSMLELACVPHKEFYGEMEKRVASYSVKSQLAEPCMRNNIKGCLCLPTTVAYYKGDKARIWCNLYCFNCLWRVLLWLSYVVIFRGHCRLRQVFVCLFCSKRWLQTWTTDLLSTWWRHQMEHFPCYWPSVRVIYMAVTNVSDAELWSFLTFAPEQMGE